MAPALGLIVTAWEIRHKVYLLCVFILGALRLEGTGGAQGEMGDTGQGLDDRQSHL